MRFSVSQTVLFRCGDWVYTGNVDLGCPQIDLSMLPNVIPALQQQQSFLSFMCESTKIPKTSRWGEPLARLYQTVEFLADELVSDRVTEALTNGLKIFKWIDEDAIFFELKTAGYPELQRVEMIASKIYARGVVLLVMYFENSFYASILESEGEQPLLDTAFPVVAAHLQGLQLRFYRDPNLKNLTLWNAPPPQPDGGGGGGTGKGSNGGKGSDSKREDVGGGVGYTQTYCIHALDSDAASRRVLFRFGEWIYTGRVELGADIGLGEMPEIISILRLQQHTLQFQCETSRMAADSPFTPALQRLVQVFEPMQMVLGAAGDTLERLIANLDARGAGKHTQGWLDGAGSEYGLCGHTFFELGCELAECEECYGEMELVATKVYTSAGVVFVIVYHGGSYYVSVTDGSNSDLNDVSHSLLDHHFPDVSRKKQGYQVRRIA
jgi:hypothetical protein